MATSAGVVGLLAFAVMWLVIVVVLWRVDPAFGTLALAVALSRIVQAQFDLFWVAAQVSIPFAIAGICLGAMARGCAARAAADRRATRITQRRRKHRTCGPVEVAVALPDRTLSARGIRWTCTLIE